MRKRVLEAILGMTMALTMLTACGDKDVDTSTKIDSASVANKEVNDEPSETEESTEESNEAKKSEEIMKEFSFMNFGLLIRYRDMTNFSDNPISSDGKYLWDLIYYNSAAESVYLPAVLADSISPKFKPVFEYVDVEGEQWFQLTLDTDNYVSETGATCFVDADGTPVGKMVFKVSPDYKKFIYKDVMFVLPESAK